MDCVFCKIISGEIQTERIFEDHTIIASFDINPASIGHIIIFPKKHYEDLGSIPPQDFFNMASVLRFLSDVLKEDLLPKGFNVVMNMGEVKNQQMTHLTIHLIPVSGTEEIVIGWKPVSVSQEEKINLAKRLNGIMARKIEEAKQKMKEHSNELFQVQKGQAQIPPVKMEETKPEPQKPKEQPQVFRRPTG